MTFAARAAVAASLALLLAGCTTPVDDNSGASTEPGVSGPGVSGEITVFAAASLTEVLGQIVDAFEAAHPGTTVEATFAGSSALATQLIEGAPADVFAAADEATMRLVVDAGLVDGNPVPFATNTLVIVTPPDNPAGVVSLADLGRTKVTTVICAPQVPCGAAALELAAAQGVVLVPASEESAVVDVLGKVTSGQADAGLVYVTDAQGAGDAVHQVAVPGADEVVNRYPLAGLSHTDNEDLTRAFIDYVSGPEGRAFLEAAGFGSP